MFMGIIISHEGGDWLRCDKCGGNLGPIAYKVWKKYYCTRECLFDALVDVSKGLVCCHYCGKVITGDDLETVYRFNEVGTNYFCSGDCLLYWLVDRKLVEMEEI